MNLYSTRFRNHNILLVLKIILLNVKKTQCVFLLQQFKMHGFSFYFNLAFEFVKIFSSVKFLVIIGGNEMVLRNIYLPFCWSFVIMSQNSRSGEEPWTSLIWRQLGVTAPVNRQYCSTTHSSCRSRRGEVNIPCQIKERSQKWGRKI